MTDLDIPLGLRAFVEDDVALLPSGLSDGDRARLIQILRERRDVARLDRLGASPDKALAKAARKALHLLSTKGDKVAVAPRVYRTTGPYAEPPPSSYASIVDGRGERVVWYVEPDDGGFIVYELELSETAGILSITAVEVSRRAWREQVAQMEKNERALVGSVAGAHVRVLIERAYRQMIADGRSPPEGFARAHMRLQASEAELAAPHPLPALVGALPPPSDAALAALLERPELQLFVPPRDAFAALDAAVGEVVGSKVQLEPAQRLARLEDAVAKVCDTTLTEARRRRLADRLLELGLLIAARQPDEEGRAAARACLAAAERATGSPPHAHPTFYAMFRRLVPAEVSLALTEP